MLFVPLLFYLSRGGETIRPASRREQGLRRRSTAWGRCRDSARYYYCAYSAVRVPGSASAWGLAPTLHTSTACRTSRVRLNKILDRKHKSPACFGGDYFCRGSPASGLCCGQGRPPCLDTRAYSADISILSGRVR